MPDQDPLTARFEAHRDRLRAVAYRMLGSRSEADDAVQETWVRFRRTDTGDVDNLAGWLTTVTARVCLDMLRARTSRREERLDDRAPVLVADPGGAGDPEHEALLADSVGVAMLVVLDRLSPAERIAFVLHDVFGMPFRQIAPIVERSPATTKKLASRARHRLRGTGGTRGADLARQRRVVEAFLAAARDGDIPRLLEVLDPDVVRRADRQAVPAGVATEVWGAREVAAETAGNAQRARFAEPALIDGAVGLLVAPAGRLQVAILPEFAGERITAIDVIAAPERLRKLDLAMLP